MIFLFHKVPYKIEITEGSYFMNDNTISEKLFSLLLRCSHALGRGHHHKEAMPGQGRVLAILSSRGSMTQRELQDVVQIRAASLSELLGKLEYKGLITRTKDDNDKRNVIVTLSEQGSIIAAENILARRETSAYLFSALSVDEQSQLTELLSKLVEAWHMEHHGDGNCENSEQLHGHHHCDEHDHHEAHGSCENHGRHHGHFHHGEDL